MPRIRYAKMSFNRACSLKQPGTTRRNPSTGVRETTQPTTHTGLYCNFRARTANERLVSGVEITKILATIIFRYSPLFDNVDASWKVILDNDEYDIIGGVEQLDPRKEVRLLIEKVA